MSICSNALTNKGCEALFSALKRNNILISLDISAKERVNRNRIDLSGLTQLSNLLSVSKTLSFLDLSLMSLGDKGIEQL